MVLIIIVYADVAETVTISRKNIIASSISEGRFDICIWVKPVSPFSIEHSLEDVIIFIGWRSKPET